MAAYVLAEKEQEGVYAKYRDVLARASLKLAEALGVEAGAKAASDFASSVPDWPAFDDTPGALRALGRKGYRRYILSNVDEDLLRETIKRNGLEVDGCVTAEETRSYKPSIGHWMMFMEKTGADKREILHVAQSVFHDIVPTERLGIAGAWVNRYGEPLPDGIQPLYICDNLSDLAALLE
jgi:2-haloalkanoic acid dehalogenase type II